MSFRLQLLTVLRAVVQVVRLTEERKVLIVRETEQGGEAMMDLGGLRGGGAVQDSRFQDEQWGLFSPVICAAISCFLQLPSPRELLRWNLNMRRRAAGAHSELAA